MSRKIKRPLDHPLNLPIELDDGRLIIVKSGSGKQMTARQVTAKNNEPIQPGDVVLATAGVLDGSKAVFQALSRTKKDIRFQILGSKPRGSWWVRLLEWMRKPGGQK
jgi:hypothetical protein